MTKILFVFLLTATGLAPLFAQQNILIIIADDLGTDYLGFYEEALDTARVPNLRSLLDRGVRFKNAWSSPFCSSARASLLTGRYAFRTGVGTVITGTANGQLDTAEITLGKLLKHTAPIPYNTANIGKWHLHTAAPANRNNPSVLGFDHYAGNFIGQLTDYYSWAKIVDGAPAVTVNNYATTEQVDDAIGWLGSLDAGKPFFLWQAFNAPHSPYHLPPAALHTVPGLTGTQQHILQNRPEYFKAMIEAMDTEIGRLFEWLEQHDQLDSTNIIFIGDNGNDGLISQISDPEHKKGTLYEYGIHVPMIISGPAVQAPNRVSEALVSVTDLFATVLEMGGVNQWQTSIPAERPVDAISLLPIIKNTAASVRPWVFSELFDPVPQPEDGKAIRDTSYKLIQFDDGRQEFYQVAVDLQEQNELLATGQLSAAAILHYDYLCNTLNNLLGSAVCQNTTDIVNPVDTGIDLQLFPNPSGDRLFLHSSQYLTGKTATITDVAGRKWAEYSIPEHGVLEVSQLPAGIFLLQVALDGSHQLVAKFVR